MESIIIISNNKVIFIKLHIFTSINNYLQYIYVIEQFSKNVPKSPIRELLELEPETAKFR